MYKRDGAQDGENMAAVAYKISRSLISLSFKPFVLVTLVKALKAA